MTTTSRITVGGQYDVLVGEDLLSEVVPLVGDASRALVVTVAAVEPVAQRVCGLLREAGATADHVTVPDGEAAKDAGVAEQLWARLGRMGGTRDDAVVAVGGGAVTDVAGFVAATWLRGVRVVHVPTTLLGMVDAAVGGKTGINTAAGKNLVGTFHAPAGVVCDLGLLATLPPAEYAGGLAEVVKAGFIGDPVILDLVESDPADALRWDGRVTRELVERSIRVKAEVVAADFREAGPREALNYGHTLAHAIEKVEGYRWRHGDAVSVGIVFAAELGRLAGRLDDATAARHRSVLTALGLQTAYAGSPWPELLEAMRIDKKARGSRLRFVVLDGLGRPGILDDPEPRLLEAAFAAVAPETSSLG